MSTFGSPVTVKTAVSSSSGPVSVTSNTALNDLIVVHIVTNGNSPTPQDVQDTIGNTYTLVPNSFVGDANGTRQRTYYCLNSIGANASNVVSYNITLAGTPVAMTVTNVPAAAGVTIDNFTNAAQATNAFASGTTTTASFSTANADEIVFIGLEMSNHATDTVVASGGNTVAGTTPPNAGSSFNGGIAYQLFSGTQSGITESLTTSTPGTNMVATIVAVGFQSAPVYTITGTIVDGSSNPISGVNVAVTGAFGTTDGSGNYTISGLVNGAYTVTPSKIGYTFSPTNASETISGSNISSVNFTGTQLTVATPTFSPVAGSYSGTQNISIGDSDSAEPGFQITYTTDGSTPIPGSHGTVYTGPVAVSNSLTLKAVASATNYINSATGSAAYTITRAITGTILDGSSNPVSGVTVAWTGSSSGSTTTNGSGNYTIGVSNGSYTITPSLTGWTFSPTNQSETVSGSDISGVNFTGTNTAVATPTFSPVAGAYGPTQTVTVSCTDSGLSGFAMTYTTDNTTPVPGSHGTVYTTPISVASTQTIKVVASATSYANSAVGQAGYTINGAVQTPTFNPPAGTYLDVTNVTISSATAGATFYYTTDGSDPPTGSTLYTAPVSVGVSETLKALAVEATYSDSSIGSAAYVINLTVHTPTFSPPAGAYETLEDVTISTTTPAATIYYTTDGSVPTTASPVFTTPVPVAESTVLKAFATADGFFDSAVGTATYSLFVPTLGRVQFFGKFQGNSFQLAFPQNKAMLDIVQIKNRSGLIVYRLAYDGTVYTDGSAATRGTILGQYPGADWNDAFVLNNSNLYMYDAMQVAQESGEVIWYLDWSGQPHTRT